MFRILWYISSILTIVLILSNQPDNNKNFTNNESAIYFRSNQKFILQLTAVTISLFFFFIVFFINSSVI